MRRRALAVYFCFASSDTGVPSARVAGSDTLTLGSGFQHGDLQSSGIVSPVYLITPSFLGGEQRTPAVLGELSPAKGARINYSPQEAQ